MHIINPRKYLTIQLCKSVDRRTNFFLCVSSDITAERLRTTSRFAQTFLTAASFPTVLRCFVNLDQLNDLSVSTSLIPIFVAQLNAWLCLTLFVK